MDYRIRKLSKKDLKNISFFETLSNLRKIKNLSLRSAQKIFNDCQKRGIETYVAVYKGEVVGTIRLLFEAKFYHSGQLAAHIEDVSTHKKYIGQGVASALIKHVIGVCQKKESYKIILDCDNDLLKFYQKFGFKKSANCLRLNM